MNDKDKTYTEWIASRSRADLPDGFTERMMGRIARQEQAVVEEHGITGIQPFVEKTINILAGFGLSALGAFRVAHLMGGLLLP